MNIDKVIKWFMPKEERFHALLEKGTQNLLLVGEGLLRDRPRHDPRGPAHQGRAAQGPRARGRRHHAPDLRGPEHDLHHAVRPRGHPLARERPRRHRRQPRERREVPGALRAQRSPRAAAALRRDPARDGGRDRHDPDPDLGHGQHAQDPGGDGPRLRAREPGRLALLHGHRRPLQEGPHRRRSRS